jgi:hypothetical protein
LSLLWKGKCLNLSTCYLFRVFHHLFLCAAHMWAKYV